METTLIGKYTTIKQIGRGTMSDVFKAFDPTQDLFVALKTIPLGPGLTEEVRSRLNRETQSAADLNHPNIITIYEHGEDDGKIYIAMELLEGSNLKDLINSEEDLELGQKLDIMEQIAEGIGFAHSKGIVHRAIKPTNIYVQPGGGVKIMDFGLAGLASPANTQSVMLMGALNYMSPEQVRDEAMDSASDVFSLGAVLYELLSNTRPFKGDTLHATLLKILRGQRQPLCDIVPELPDPLVQAVDRALSISPTERYKNGNELMEDLREFRKTIGSVTTAEKPTGLEMSGGAVTAQQAGATPESTPSIGDVPTRSLSGSLKTVHLADLLQWCAIHVKTGTLQLRQGSIEKRLYFRDGQLFSSTSNSPREVLGQLLIRSGLIDEEQLFTALLEQEQSKEPLGWILVSKGLLAKSKLQKLLQVKCEESIYDCFLWTDGEHAFEEYKIPENMPVTFSVDISRVIREGIDHMNKWERIREQFPSRLTTFVLKREIVDGSEGNDLTDGERSILELVDRRKNLAEIALELHAVDYYAASLVQELCERGFIKVHKVPQESPYERQAQGLRDRLAKGLESFDRGEHTEALAAFEAAADKQFPSEADAFEDKIASMMEDADAVKKVNREAIPVLKVTLDEIAKMRLAPQEGFVLSRISGDWDVRSILKICPLGELEVLQIIKGFMDRGIIELKSN
jgi:serine/threonine protein kinase